MKTKSALLTALFLAVTSVMGCDVDDEGEFSRVELLDADEPTPHAKFTMIPLDAPEELEIEIDEADWSEFDLSDAIEPAASPLRCCVNCADGWSGWWDRGTAPNCNQRAAKWCHDHNWNFLNAEWFNSCPG